MMINRFGKNRLADQRPHPRSGRVIWRLALTGFAALLLTGMAARRSTSESLASTIIRPITQLIQKVTNAFLPPTNPPPPTSTIEINPEAELVIRALAVVNDDRAAGDGPWSFGTLLRNMAPAGVDPADFTEAWFRVWIETVAENDHDFITAPAGAPDQPDPQAAADRAASLEQFLSNWPRRADGKLDLSNAPFRLLAIVNRLDLAEARLSFSGYISDTQVYPDREVGDVLDLAIIVEYELPPLAADGTVQDLAWWANQWHNLSKHPTNSPAYASALETLTNRFTSRGVSPDRINASALKKLRANEQVSDLGFGIDVTPVWQCMGFQLSAENQFLEVELLADTPHYDYEAFACDDADSDMCQQQLADYLVANQGAILNGAWHLDPGGPIRPAKSAPEYVTSFSWLATQAAPAGMSDEQWSVLRNTFSNFTCNGCHSNGRGYPADIVFPPHEFFHISERDAPTPSVLSPFLKQQIRDVRIPNLLSYLSPQDARARRVDPRRRPVH